MMKHKVFLGILTLLAFFGLAMKQPNVNDHAHIYNATTSKLVSEKNETYQTSKLKEKPVIDLVSITNNDAFKCLKPHKNQVLIVTIHQKKNNVQILVGSNFKKTLSATTTSNIIRYAGDELRSSNNRTFNKGIRKVFNACTTLIDQELRLPADKNALSNNQLQKINHPQSVNFVWGIIIAIGATIVFSWYQRRNKR